MTATGDLTANRIIAAGRQLIMRRGYHGFSYADIAEAIDIRKASIHHHFPAKTDLVIAVLNEWREAFDADVESLQASGADAIAQLRAYIGHWERCIADDTAPFCVAGMLGAELPSLPEDVAQVVKTFFDSHPRHDWDSRQVWASAQCEFKNRAITRKIGSVECRTTETATWC